MTWQIEFTKTAAKQFAKLDRPVKQRIVNFLENKLATIENPRLLGKPLQGTLSEYWSYRLGDYRILTKHKDDLLIVLVIEIGHRKEVYK